MRLARKLQRAIETYRLPRNIGHGTHGRRLGRVFRDQDELAASQSLPDGIRTALKHARALIVVCSPRSRESAWMEQEVKLFASFHGRNRIYVALAEGEPNESVPALLLSRTVAAPDGSAFDEPIEPLAADFREPPRGQFRMDKLRIIAGMAGCAFDDLRQRERQRKRTAAAAFCAAALAVLVGLLAYQIHAARDVAQIQESLNLAAQSQQLFAEGDRFGAIEVALSALPSKDNPDVPETEEAKEALFQALELNQASRAWLPAYVVDSPERIYQMAISENGDWFALMDTNCQVHTYDKATGKLLANCTPYGSADCTISPQGPYWNIVAAGDNLIVAPRSQIGDACLTCFDAHSGEEKRHKDSFFCNGLAASDDGSALAMVIAAGENGTIVAVFDAEAGDVAAAKMLEEKVPAFKTRLPVTFGSAISQVFFASGDKVVAVSFLDDKVSSATLPLEMPSSIFYDESSNVLAVASFKPLSPTTGETTESTDSIPYSVSAFDASPEELEPIWSDSGTFGLFTIKLTNGDHFPSLTTPELWGTASLDQPAILFSAGQHLRAYSASDGSSLYDRNATTAIVGARAIPGTKNENSLVGCFEADGAFSLYDPAGRLDGPISNVFNVSFPCALWNGCYM